jgi:type VI secretion system protein VasJ
MTGLMAEYLDALLEQTTALRAPFDGAEPAGPDVSLEEPFEKIKAELDKMTSLSGGDVDWRIVHDGSDELLRSKTKDLRLAVWMTAAAFERGGWTDLARGLLVTKELATQMWDVVLPKRDKARINILVWLSERISPALDARNVSLEDADAVRACADLAAELDRLGIDKLGDAYPGMRGLVQGAKRRVLDIPAPPPPPPPTPAPVSTPAANAASEWIDDDDDGPPPVADDDDDDDGPSPVAAAPSAQSLDGPSLSTRAEDAQSTSTIVGEALVALAQAMLRQSSSRAWAYRLHRLGIWMPFERVDVEDGVLRAMSPEIGVRERLSALLSEGRYLELALAAEEASAHCPLWLDAQHFAGIALEHLGTAYIDARAEVGRGACAFARQNPALLAAHFSDGTPVASAETAQWFHAEAFRFALPGSRAAQVSSQEDRELTRRFGTARAMVAAGQVSEGLAVAVQTARRGHDPRARFHAQLAVAQLAISASAPKVARPILEELVITARTHALETWEPALAAQLYTLLYACLPGTDEAARNDAFEALCRLDPGAAVRLGRGPGASPAPAEVAGSIRVPGFSAPETSAEELPPTYDDDDD